MMNSLFLRFIRNTSKITSSLSGRTLATSIFSQVCAENAYRAWISGAFSFPGVASRSYSRGDRKHYNLFGNVKPGDEEFRKSWSKQMGEEDEEESVLWTESEDGESGSEEEHREGDLEDEIRRVRRKAKEHSNLIDGDDSDELYSVWSGSDMEKTLWTGSELDDSDDDPTEAYANKASDRHIDKIFEFEGTRKFRSFSLSERWSTLEIEPEEPEFSPGKEARKVAVEEALKKLKKGPDGRYTNVWEVMSDTDMLIGAFDNIVSGPEYEELREGGPKRLNMEFFKDIQAKMRDPNYKFSPELKLKPKSKFVARKKWLKTQSRRRKARRR